MSKVLKLGMVALLLFLGLSFTKKVDAYYDYSDKVEWIEICGYDYNDSEGRNKVPGVTWNENTNTVTVKNCNAVTDSNFINYWGELPLNVVFEGTNNISYNQVEDGYNNGNFMRTDTNEDISISGSGTLNIDHFGSFIEYGSATDNKSSDCTISGITLNTDGSSISSDFGNLTLKNTNIYFKKKNNETSDLMIGSNDADPDGNGTITIDNSTLEIAEMYEGRFRCKKLITNGYIYGGAGKAQYSFNTTNLFKIYSVSTPVVKESLDGITYLLFTNTNKGLPAYTANKTNPNEMTPKTNTVTKPAKPGKPSIKKLKNKKKRKVSISWSAVFGADSYQVGYALNKKFSKKYKTASVYGTSKTFKKLKKKKTYFFRVRAYKNTSSGKLFGAWSGVKKVKIKK